MRSVKREFYDGRPSNESVPKIRPFPGHVARCKLRATKVFPLLYKRVGLRVFYESLVSSRVHLAFLAGAIAFVANCRWNFYREEESHAQQLVPGMKSIERLCQSVWRVSSEEFTKSTSLAWADRILRERRLSRRINTGRAYVSRSDGCDNLVTSTGYFRRLLSIQCRTPARGVGKLLFRM